MLVPVLWVLELGASATRLSAPEHVRGGASVLADLGKSASAWESALRWMLQQAWDVVTPT